VTAAGQESNSFTANTQQFAPAFFTFAGGKYVAALHADYSYLAAPSLVAGATPAQPGEVILLYGTCSATVWNLNTSQRLRNRSGMWLS
jgi:uncharacterized protein (TIGR03437 family)